MSYGLSGVAMAVVSIATYETITSVDILLDWAGPSLAGGIIASTFAYSFLTHS